MINREPALTFTPVIMLLCRRKDDKKFKLKKNNNTFQGNH